MFIIERLIGRPKSDVFRLLADVERTPLWYSAVTSVRRLSQGPAGKGATYEFTRQLGGNEVTNRVIISGYEPDTTLEIASISGPTPFIYRYELESAYPDDTVLRLVGRISGAGLTGPARLFAPFAESFFEAGMRTNLESLTKILTGQPSAA